MEYDKITYYEFDKKGKKELLKKLQSLLISYQRIKLAYVFGSFSRLKSIRDLDVAIYATPSFSFKKHLKLSSMLELKLKMPIDLVQLQDLSPSFRYKVLSEAIPVILDKELHHTLLAMTFSELQDLKIARQYAAHKARS